MSKPIILGAVSWIVPRGVRVISEEAPLPIQKAVPPWHVGKPLERWLIEDSNRPRPSELQKWLRKIQEEAERPKKRGSK